MIGFSLKKTIGIGDAIQFTSVPENYYKTFKKKLIDTNNHWVFDHNPYVEKKVKLLSKTVELWNYRDPQPIPTERPSTNKDGVYLSLAERHASIFGAKVFNKFPRLYIHEDYPFSKRTKILLQVEGKSHGKMPDKIIEHVLKKYKYCDLYQICGGVDTGLPKIETPDVWDLVKIISESRMIIGLDSGPSWIAACYPDVIIKKVRTKPRPDVFRTWIPMQVGNIHSHWDDRTAIIHNTTDDDIGMTASYKRI